MLLNVAVSCGGKLQLHREEEDAGDKNNDLHDTELRESTRRKDTKEIIGEPSIRRRKEAGKKEGEERLGKPSITEAEERIRKETGKKEADGRLGKGIRFFCTVIVDDYIFHYTQLAVGLTQVLLFFSFLFHPFLY